MENKDLLWVRPDYTPGKPAAEKPARKRKPSKDEPFVDDGKQTTFTAAQIASMWQYSTATVRRMFENEPGVQVIGRKTSRGKRRRITLRIPRSVMERVKKRTSNIA